MIERVNYSRGILDATARLIFDAEDELAAVGFAISGIEAVDLQHDGLRCTATTPPQPVSRSLGQSLPPSKRSL